MTVTYLVIRVQEYRYTEVPNWALLVYLYLDFRPKIYFEEFIIKSKLVGGRFFCHTWTGTRTQKFI